MKSKTFTKKDLEKAFKAGEQYDFDSQFLLNTTDFDKFYKQLVKNDKKNPIKR
jgi:hypothetical protein